MMILKSILFMKKKIPLYLAGIVFMAFLYGFILDTYLSVLFQRMIDAALNGNYDSLLTEGIRLFCITAASCFLCPLLSCLVFYLIKKTVTELRIQVFRKALDMPVSYHETQHSSSIISCLNQDLFLMEQIYFWPVFRILLLTLIGIGAAAALFFYQPVICFVSIAFGGAALVVNLLYGRSLKKNTDKIWDSMDSMNEILMDMMNGAEVFPMFNVMQILKRKFLILNHGHRRNRMSFSKKEGSLAGINSVMNYAAYIVVCVLGVYYIFQGELTAGAAIACLELRLGINFVINEYSGIIGQIQYFSSGTERVIRILHETEEEVFQAAKGYDAVPSDKALFELYNISYSYVKANPIFDKLNLSIEKGKKIGVVGKSGCGKSTLTGIMMGFYEQDYGALFYNGRPYADFTKEEIRNKISYVPQDPYVFQDSIRSNIGVYGETLEEIILAAKTACIHDFIESLPDGYDTLILENRANLSGGQKQRIAIARALLKKSDLIILDEAASALEDGLEIEIFHNIESNGYKQAILMISHKEESLQHMDLVFTIRDKKLFQVISIC